MTWIWRSVSDWLVWKVTFCWFDCELIVILMSETSGQGPTGSLPFLFWSCQKCQRRQTLNDNDTNFINIVKISFRNTWVITDNCLRNEIISLSSPSPKSKVLKLKPKGLWLTLKSHGPPTNQPPHPITFKHEGVLSGKKVLIVKVAHPAKKIDVGRGVVLHVQEEVYQSTLTFRRRVAGYQKWCPWSI